MITLAGLEIFMALIKADGTNGLDGGTVNLFKNDLTPNKDTVVGDLTVADYNTYAAQTVTTWQAAYLDSNGRLVILAPAFQFQPTDALAPNNIYGYWVENKAGDLVAAYRFPTAPIGLNGPLDVLNMQAAVRLLAG